MGQITIGSVTSRPGEVATGWFESVQLPTGPRDRIPIILAQGKEADGPVLWITTGIHGGEHTGLITVQRLLRELPLDELRGTLGIIPALSPGGLRVKMRNPYYFNSDPNRLFPAPIAKEKERDGSPPLSEIEIIYANLYEALIETQPEALIDLHNAWIGSLPFAFRDPVFYRRGRGDGLTKSEARQLQDRVGAMLSALGFTVINEYAASDYVKKNLHRSVSGAMLNRGRIPAITMELGSWMHVDPHVVEATVTGLQNVMRWAGLLDGDPTPIEGIPVIDPGFSVRREVHPYAPVTGIVHHLARPGDMVNVGDPIVQMTDIFGNPILDDAGTIRSEHDGFVLAWHHGVIRYQSEPIMDMAIRDEGELVMPLPE